METNYTNQEDFQSGGDFENIISINTGDDMEDLQDFDFDYDPNEMYYALVNERN